MIRLEKIVPTEEQLRVLYRLLASRKHGISHERQPSYAEHTAFVRDHPYRAWLLVRDADTCIGSVYVHTDNTIGLNLEDNHVAGCLDEVLDNILKAFKPLPAVKSVRNGSFSINVAPTNRALISALETRGCRIGQVTYFLADQD